MESEGGKRSDRPDVRSPGLDFRLRKPPRRPSTTAVMSKFASHPVLSFSCGAQFAELDYQRNCYPGYMGPCRIVHRATNVTYQIIPASVATLPTIPCSDVVHLSR
ncbi:uncharacterized protein LOC142803797 [Rhipicephalus microplus]|uniref:uncharacterized protein LOC142803797 n=1 Tax=Rhipicephalus microplus TaxID=6941 RepID=UPI003F6CAA84